VNIYIDESGSFVEANHVNSWNAVSAISCCDCSENVLKKAVGSLKTKLGKDSNSELKLYQIPEKNYFEFLQEVEATDILVHTVATDAGRNPRQVIIDHRGIQAAKILENVPRMIHKEGRESVRSAAAQIEQLSPQLYLQLVCQIQLMNYVVGTSINYFVQSNPECLSSFSWQVDQKNTTKTEYEAAFEKLSPVFLQSASISNPFIKVEEFDYSTLGEYYYKKGEAPKYLKNIYGIDADEGLNIQKIIRDDLEFVDSKRSHGVQAIDLIVSGIRRCFRLEFSDNQRAAELLGKLMTTPLRNDFPIALVTLKTSEECSPQVATLIKIMAGNSKTLLK